METNFTTLGILPVLVANLEKSNILVPTQIQTETVPVILQNSDLIAVAQTGSGKTLAYLLPILTRLQSNPLSRAVVLSPTRETSEQIHRVFKEISAGLTLSSCLAVTGVPVATQNKELKKTLA